MATILRALNGTYTALNDEWSDGRTNEFWMMSSPFPILALVSSYIYFSCALGPLLMEERKPFNLDWIIRIFDLTQIVANLYIFYQCVTLGWGGTYSWRCEPIDRSDSHHAMQVARMVHFYFLVKVVDLLDTVFFVLRKKESHISFLHVYHHAGMVLAAWVGVKFYPGGHVTFLGLVNSLVHAIMYTYYFLTSLNPEYKKMAWWKKYITQLQMFQFLCIIVHMSQLFFWNPCNHPLLPVAVLVPQNVFMLVLFYDFYRKAYKPQKTD